MSDFQTEKTINRNREQNERYYDSRRIFRNKNNIDNRVAIKTIQDQLK